MFDDFLEFCTLDNSLFRHGLFWVFIFCITFSYFIRFKLLEARENAIENEIINKYIESQNLRKSGSAGRKPASQTSPEQKQVKELPVHTPSIAEASEELEQSPEPRVKQQKKKDSVKPLVEVKMATYEPHKAVEIEEEDWNYVQN